MRLGLAGRCSPMGAWHRACCKQGFASRGFAAAYPAMVQQVEPGAGYLEWKLSFGEIGVRRQSGGRLMRERGPRGTSQPQTNREGKALGSALRQLWYHWTGDGGWDGRYSQSRPWSSNAVSARSQRLESSRSVGRGEEWNSGVGLSKGAAGLNATFFFPFAMTNPKTKPWAFRCTSIAELPCL